ncbi:UNVERIFIED_CONTAM: hypothetical protein GTU68_043272 [Idotea baltica]|nr:hypothetical protein [Idotea baltica]
MQQLDNYFRGQKMDFDLPITMAGTDFQKSVWNTLLTIKHGQTASYLELATKLGRVSAVRAVANANAANALSIIIPCHRIIGHNGQLVGYAGGLDVKRKLLKLESN